MLARRFGYAVSPEPAAATTPAVLEQLRPPMERARRMRRFMVVLAVVGTAVLAVVLAVQFESAALVAVACVVMPVFCLFMWVMERNDRPSVGSLTGPEANALAPVLEREPWQVWPCRVEQVEAHTWGATVHVFLLDPNENTAAVLKTRLQHRTWMSLTDGYGVLWFAGDLRFGGVLADPSDPEAAAGPTVSYAAPVPRDTAAPPGGNSVIAEELRRQAVGWVFGQL
ncbi:hypothetical protein [Actinomadura rifamycini]|uniref:hypothetical protein n=1 Tax=Actinomadura rifamycini TaxID=31962 RepID=UPI0012F7166D|nr:hypothetical protein [Actinomadura rifamycini]